MTDFSVATTLDYVVEFMQSCFYDSVNVLHLLIPIAGIFVFWILYKPYFLNRNHALLGFQHVPDINALERNTATKMVLDVIKRRSRLGELPPVFPNAWIPILSSNKLKIGQSKTITALGQDFAVFRGTNGRAYVLDAYCPHLGANLGVGGKVKDVSCIRCPFHGWQFDGEDGKCKSIPYSEKIPPSAEVRSWKTCEKSGLIFVWYHAEDEPPSWEITEIEEISSGKWIEKARVEHTTYCHIQEIQENGADVTHFWELHPEVAFTGSDIRKKSGGIWSSAQHKWLLSWSPGEPPNSHTGFVDIQVQHTLFGHVIPGLTVKTKAKEIGPALVYVIFSTPLFNFAIIQSTTPEGPLQQRIITSLYYDWKIPSIVGKAFAIMEAVQLERDVMIWNNKKFLKNPILVQEDHLVLKYRRWYAQFYSPNSPTLREVNDRRLDW